MFSMLRRWFVPSQGSPEQLNDHVRDEYLFAFDPDTGQRMVPLEDYGIVLMENRELRLKLDALQSGD